MRQEVSIIAHGQRMREVVVGVALAFTVIIMNATPEHFDYPDTDGCAGFVAYTTHPALAMCDQSRPRNCDGLDFDGLLVRLAYLDFNR